MRTFSSSFVIALGLSTSAYGQGHQRRQLTEILGKLQGGYAGENAALASHISAGLANGGSLPPGGATTIILGGPGGNPLEAITTTNHGAIWITTSGQQNAPTSIPNPVAGSPPAAQEPTTTLLSTLQSTTTLTVPATNQTIPAGLPSNNTAVPPAAASPAAGQGTLPPILLPSAAPQPGNPAVPASNSILPPQQQFSATGGATLPAILQPSAILATGGAQQQPPATGGFLPPILQPSSVPAGVFPTPIGAVPPTAVQPGALTTGTGTIINGECNCQCLCPSAAFPNMGSVAPVAPVNPALPQPIANTTFQTVILPPTSSVTLPSSILIDTNTPPAGTPSSQPAPPARNSPPTALPVVTSVPAENLPSTTAILPPSQSAIESSIATPTTVQVLPPAQSAVESSIATPTTVQLLPPAQSAVDSSIPVATTVASSLQLSLTNTNVAPPPTALPELASSPSDQSSVINISTFSLVSSLVLDL